MDWAQDEARNGVWDRASNKWRGHKRRTSYRDGRKRLTKTNVTSALSIWLYTPQETSLLTQETCKTHGSTTKGGRLDGVLCPTRPVVTRGEGTKTIMWQDARRAPSAS